MLINDSFSSACVCVCVYNRNILRYTISNANLEITTRRTGVHTTTARPPIFFFSILAHKKVFFGMSTFVEKYYFFPNTETRLKYIIFYRHISYNARVITESNMKLTLRFSNYRCAILYGRKVLVAYYYFLDNSSLPRHYSKILYFEIFFYYSPVSS